MNSIPLIKGNTPQEINTSIIALKKALSELEAQDRLLQGTDKDVQDKIKQINELIEGINTHLGTVDTHLSTIDGQITALQPVDEVTSGNMQSVTSNAVANELLQKASVINEIYGESHSFIMKTLIGLKNFALIILQAGTAELSYSVGIYTEFGGYRINWLYNYIPNSFSFNPNTTELTISAFVRILILY